MAYSGHSLLEILFDLPEVGSLSVYALVCSRAYLEAEPTHRAFGFQVSIYEFFLASREADETRDLLTSGSHGWGHV